MADASGAVDADSPVMAMTDDGAEPEWIGSDPADEGSSEAVSHDGSEQADALGTTMEKAGAFSGDFDPRSAFASDEGGQVEEDGDAEESGDQEGQREEPQKASPRAEKRIRALSTRLKETTDRYAQLENYVKSGYQENKQLTQHNRALAQRFQEQQVENARLATRLESIEKHGLPQQREADPAAEFERKFKQDIEEQLLAKLNPEVEGLKKQLADRDRAEANARARAQSMQRRQGYLQTSDKVTDEVLLSGVSDDAKQELRPVLGALTLALAHGSKKDIPTAAKMLDSLFNKWALARMDARARTKGGRVKASKSVTTPPSQSRQRANGNAVPSREAVERAGARDELELMMSQTGFLG